MNEKLLTSVRVVFAARSVLPHVAELIDAFRFSNGKWTLESASKRGFLRKLECLLEKERWQEPQYRSVRSRSAVYVAVKCGYDVCVLNWWLTTYEPEAKQELMSDALRNAILFKCFDVLWCLWEEHQDFHCEETLDCSDPTIAHWIHKHGNNLLVQFPMYECCAADPTFDFAKWCLIDQDVFTCDKPQEAVSFAIDHGNEEFLQWLHQYRQNLFQSDHLDCALSRGQLTIAKWLLEKFPR